MSKAEQVEQVIAALNARGLTEQAFGGTHAVRARKPILATDCDYEIVRVSGVQGVKLPASKETNHG